MTVQDQAAPTYHGFQVVDRGPWRTISCTACHKSRGLQTGVDDVDELTDLYVGGHRCGPIGTPWTVPGPPGPGPAHALLLRSITREVYAAGCHLYVDDPEVVEAAMELQEALGSQLHGAFVATADRVAFDQAQIAMIPPMVPPTLSCGCPTQLVIDEGHQEGCAEDLEVCTDPGCSRGGYHMVADHRPDDGGDAA